MVRGKKLAVLVGCNYPSSDNELTGCHQDVLVMQNVLVRDLGFHNDSIEVLIDKPDSNKKPTGVNIKQALNRMIDRAQPGDVLFFHFSGHGTKFRSSNTMVEAILPWDLNYITSLDLRHLVDRVPKGATFTILADSCNSGGLIDKETEQIGPQHPTHNVGPSICPSDPHSLKPKMIHPEAMLPILSSMTGLDSEDISTHQMALFGPDASILFRVPPHQHPGPLKPDQGILLSACQSNENAQDLGVEDGDAYGAFSDAVVQIIQTGRSSGHLTNREVVINARKFLDKHCINDQHPCLYCSNKNADAAFLGYP